MKAQLLNCDRSLQDEINSGNEFNSIAILIYCILINSNLSSLPCDKNKMDNYSSLTLFYF